MDENINNSKSTIIKVQEVFFGPSEDSILILVNISHYCLGHLYMVI